MEQKDLLKEIISHCKEYGYVFPSSEIYDGLAATYDYGQLGAELKNNIKTYWWKSMTQLNSNIVGIDSAIFMHPTTWKASGHVDAFNDPLIDNKDSKKRYRADVLLEEYLEKQNLNFHGTSFDAIILKIDSNISNRFYVLENDGTKTEEQIFESIQGSFFAVNAGSTDANCDLLGLYIKEKITLQPVNLNNGEGKI